MKQHITTIAFSLLITAMLTSCGGKGRGTKAGSKLKGEDAKSYLAGDKEKEWVLESGHDYYEYILFKADNNATILPGITKITYAVNGDNLLMKDYTNLSYTIIEISDETFKMVGSNKDTLTYKLHKQGTEEAKKWSADFDTNVNAKWLKGKYGTTWRFSEGGKTYSYMNDGKIVDAVTLRKIADWKIEDKTLVFGESKLAISRLTPIFFDYSAYDIPVKMNYIGEANADGSLRQ